LINFYRYFKNICKNLSIIEVLNASLLKEIDEVESKIIKNNIIDEEIYSLIDFD